MNWYLAAIKKYAVFTGRARRKEFWMFVLFNIIISFALGVIESLGSGPIEFFWGLVGLIYSLAVILPAIGVTIRRLHDTDRSGWWILLGLIPLIGTLVLLFFAATEGTRGSNQYGPDPRADG